MIETAPLTEEDSLPTDFPDDRLPVSYKKTKKMLSRDEVLARMEEKLKDLEKIDANAFEKLLDRMEGNK